MRYLFRKAVPEIRRVLLVESGPRTLSERFLPVLRKVCGEAVEVDLFTCLPPPPPGAMPGVHNVYRSQDYLGRPGRLLLLKTLRANGYQGMVMFCADSPLLFRSKWALALRLPVKVLIANENADCFWLDSGHWRSAKSMLAGVTGCAVSPRSVCWARCCASPLCSSGCCSMPSLFTPGAACGFFSAGSPPPALPDRARAAWIAGFARFPPDEGTTLVVAALTAWNALPLFALPGESENGNTEISMGEG